MPEERRFTFTRESQYPRLALAVIVITLVEAPAVHAIALTKVHGALWPALFWGLHLSSIYWFWNDRRRLIESAHVVTAEALVLRLGDRLRADISRAEIIRAVVEPAPRADPMAKKRVRKDAAWVTPLEPPNVKIELCAPARLRGRFSRVREATALRVFVDAPETFVAALAAISAGPRGE